MAMTTIGGIGGDITFNPANYKFKISAWEATHFGPTADITGFSSKDYVEVYPHGVTGLTARAIGVGLDAAGDTVQGSGGDITIAGFVMKFDSWVLNIGVTTADTTGFVDGGWVVGEPMLGVISGTATGTIIEEFAPFDQVAIGGTPATTSGFLSDTTLTVNPGITIVGTALVHSVRVARSITGKMVGTVNFTFTGDPTATVPKGPVVVTWAANPPIPLAMLAVTFAPANAKAIVTLTVDALRDITFPGIVRNTMLSRSENARLDVVYDIISRGEVAWNGW